MLCQTSAQNSTNPYVYPTAAESICMGELYDSAFEGFLYGRNAPMENLPETKEMLLELEEVIEQLTDENGMNRHEFADPVPLIPMLLDALGVLRTFCHPDVEFADGFPGVSGERLRPKTDCMEVVRDAHAVITLVGIFRKTLSIGAEENGIKPQSAKLLVELAIRLGRQHDRMLFRLLRVEKIALKGQDQADRMRNNRTNNQKLTDKEYLEIVVMLRDELAPSELFAMKAKEFDKRVGDIYKSRHLRDTHSAWETTKKLTVAGRTIEEKRKKLLGRHPEWKEKLLEIKLRTNAGL